MAFNDGSLSHRRKDEEGKPLESIYLLPFEKVPQRNTRIVKLKYYIAQLAVLLDKNKTQSLKFDKKLLLLLDNGLPARGKIDWRPWLCARHLYLFPPPPKVGNKLSLFYDKRPSRDHCPGGYQYLRLPPKFFFKPVLTTLTTYHILITTKKQKHKVQVPWFYSISDAIFPDGADLFDQKNDAMSYLFEDASRFHPSSARELLLITAKQTKPNLFKLDEVGFFCKHCDERDNSKLVSYLTIFNVSSIPTSRQNFESRIAMFYPRIRNAIWKSLDRHHHLQAEFWFPYLFDEKLRVWLTVMEILPKLPTDLLLPFLDVVGIWAVLNNLNGSVIHRRDEKNTFAYPYDCTFPFLYPEIEPVLNGLGYSDISIRHKNLKFIACSIPEENGLFFQELYSVFDYEIWICLALAIFMSGMLTSTIIQYLDKSIINFKSLLWDLPMTSVFDYSIVLLEQGGIISKPVRRNSCLKILIGSYILVCIVLSNAYKNENITRLTAPRSRTEFKNFSELVEHKFQIFSRVIDSNGEEFQNFSGNDPRYRLNMDMTDQHKLFVKTHDHRSASLFTEILFYADKISRGSLCREYSSVFKAEWIPPFVAYCENATQMYFLNNTRIHPNWKNLATRNVSVASVINSCNKTAFVMPEDALVYTYNEITSSTLPSDAIIHRGEDKLFGIVYGLKFGRWINPLVLQRFKWFTSAGVFDQGYKLAGFITKIRTKKPTVNENEPKASNMRGNISVVFFLLPVGFFVSCLGFLYEITSIIEYIKYFEAIYSGIRAVWIKLQNLFFPSNYTNKTIRIEVKTTSVNSPLN
ncbi:unnamed protein product [Orchesella dallaii]|uniref:Uncharacterized protein n=1 Tax=Orchesella dallaii TaxID=48710 RepID=A0ABP1RN34_9HEXA